MVNQDRAGPKESIRNEGIQLEIIGSIKSRGALNLDIIERRDSTLQHNGLSEEKLRNPSGELPQDGTVNREQID